METTNNKNGFTLLELLVSIAVASIVLIMLMQILVMSVEARNYTYLNSTLQTEAYLLAEQIKNEAFDHETQYVKINETATDITVTFVHKWDITINASNVILWTEVPQAEQNLVLVFEKNNNRFTFDGVVMHSSNILFEYEVALQETDIVVESIDGICDPYDDVLYPDGCEDVVLSLTLYISIYENGVPIDTKKFETTIII